MAVPVQFFRVFAVLLMCVVVGWPLKALDDKKKIHVLNIQSQSLVTALKALSRTTGLEVIYFTDIAEGVQSAPVRGVFTSGEDALVLMLSGTSLEVVHLVGQEAVGIRPKILKENALEHSESGQSETSSVESTELSGLVGQGEKRSIDEIFVTATRRRSTVRDVPYNIQAISERSLAQAGVRSMKDFVHMIPGLSFTDEGARDGIRVFLRGLRSGDDIGLVPTTAIYVDDTLIERPLNFRPFNMKVIDIERVEVLRGPQGTLYGGGSIGGTIRYISKKPALDAWDGRMTARGSFTRHGGENYELSGMVNAPVVKDKAGLRVNLARFHNDGFLDNIALGETNVDWDKTFASRAAFRLKPSGPLVFDLIYQRDESSYGDRARYDEAYGEFNLNNGFYGYKKNTTQLMSLNIAYDAGFAEFTSSTSYFDESVWSVQDITTRERDLYYAGLLPDDVPVPEFTAYNEVSQNAYAFSEEFRVVSTKDSRFDWIVGAYYYKAVFDGGFDEYVKQPFAYQDTFESWLGVTLNDEHKWRGRADENAHQWAVFGELGFQITDKWHVSSGVRHYDFYRDAVNSQINQWTPEARNEDGLARLTPVDTEVSRGMLEENGQVFRFNMSYRITEDSLAYATIAEGFRPGGFNAASSATQVPEDYRQYESDEIISYEIGGKFSFADHRAYLSSALYYIDWSDMQTQIQLPSLFGLRGNAGKAHSKGFELELNTQDLLSRGLAATVTYAFTDARLDETVNGIGLKGERTPMVPRHTASALFHYSQELNSGWKLGLNALFTYTGKSYTDFGPVQQHIYDTSPNEKYLSLEGYFMANASFQIEKGDWLVRLFADNIFDASGHLYRFWAVSLSPYRPSTSQTVITRPRTIGLEITKNF